MTAEGKAYSRAVYQPGEGQWRPTPVLLPKKSDGRRSLVGCSPRGRWVGHDWATSLSLFTFMHWRRKWQPTSVFLPGESQGRRSLVGCRLWGGGAWWAAVYGVAQSWTRLTRLTSSSLSAMSVRIILRITQYILKNDWQFPGGPL